MPKWIERWWIRSINRTQCSPSLLIGVAIVILGLVVYKYHVTIVRTIVITMLCVIGILALSGVSMIVWSFIRWNRQKNRSFTVKAATVKGGTAPADPGIVEVPDDIVTEGAKDLVSKTEAFLKGEAAK